jgi:hypothetical protein
MSDDDALRQRLLEVLKRVTPGQFALAPERPTA